MAVTAIALRRLRYGKSQTGQRMVAVPLQFEANSGRQARRPYTGHHAIPQLGKSIEYCRDEHVAGHPADRIQVNRALASSRFHINHFCLRLKRPTGWDGLIGKDRLTMTY